MVVALIACSASRANEVVPAVATHGFRKGAFEFVCARITSAAAVTTMSGPAATIGSHRRWFFIGAHSVRRRVRLASHPSRVPVIV